MKRRYISDPSEHKTQCWIGNKLIWIDYDNCMTVFYYDDSGVVIESSVLYPQRKELIVSSRAAGWDWQTRHTEEDSETVEDWVAGSFFKGAERDAMRIPSVFFSGQYSGGIDEWIADVEKAILQKEAENVDL